MKIGFLLTALFISSVSAQVSRKLIYGGTEVTPNRYPYLASLYKRNTETGDLAFACTGSLIAPSVILTAAHCETRVGAGIDVAKLGLHDLTMSEKMPHESYNISSHQKVMNSWFDPKTSEGDYMLLFLDRPSVFQPVLLNNNPDIPKTGELVTQMGWGKDETGYYSDVPKETTLKTWSNIDCGLAWATANSFLDLFGISETMGVESTRLEITDSSMCVDDGDTSSGCQGDSGAPLIVKGKNASSDLLVAVSVGGMDLCRLPSSLSYWAGLIPYVSNRVSSAMSWIDEELSEANNTST